MNRWTTQVQTALRDWEYGTEDAHYLVARGADLALGWELVLRGGRFAAGVAVCIFPSALLLLGYAGSFSSL